MKKFTVTVILVLMLAVVGAADAGEFAQVGYIVNIVAQPHGLLLQLDSGIPAACDGTVGHWMIIPNDNKTMLAVALLNSDNNKLMEFYTEGNFVEGICQISMMYVQGY